MLKGFFINLGPKTLKNTDLSALFGINLEEDQKQKSTVLLVAA